MALQETARVGKRGTLTIPATLWHRFNFEDGSLVIAEETPEGLLIRPATAVPVKAYSLAREAEFFLSNSVDEEEC